MKRCLICGCVVENNVDVCPQCKATKFEEIKDEEAVKKEAAAENKEEKAEEN